MLDDAASLQIVDTSPEPIDDAGWFFLVRGDNACGTGRYETATDGSDRPTTVCP
jgi:hypothetical protein